MLLPPLYHFNDLSISLKRIFVGLNMPEEKTKRTLLLTVLTVQDLSVCLYIYVYPSIYLSLSLIII